REGMMAAPHLIASARPAMEPDFSEQSDGTPEPASVPALPLPLVLSTGKTSAGVTLLGWALLATLAAIVIPAVLLIGVMPQDEGYLLEYPRVLASGALPYRDVWMSYPPGAF